jgi:hypothetical protein
MLPTPRRNVRGLFRYVLRKDELAMTAKRDKSFAAKRRAFDEAEGRLKESRRREDAHREENHRGFGQDSEEVSPAQKLSELRECISLNDREKVEQAIFAMGAAYNGWIKIPDEIVDGLLDILREPHLHESELAAHVLNYFEFESPRLSSRQKHRVKGFLEAHGDSFTDVWSAQVVTELKYESYLN